MASRREAILADALLSLEAIGGGSYLTAPRTRARELPVALDDLTAMAFPALFVAGAGEEKERLDSEQIVSRLQVEVRGFLRRQARPAISGPPLSAQINDLIADVERALAADETRGQNASSTTPVAVEVDESTFDEIAGFLARFEVQYSYPFGDP